MTILDLILILILFFFTFSGFFFGAIHTLGALLGTIAGVLVAGHYFESLADKINPVPIASENLAKVVAFIIIFIIASRVVGLIFLLIDKIFKVLSFIPFLKAINRLAGAVFGLVEGAVVLGVVLFFIGKFPFADFLIPAIESSEVAQWLLKIGDILVPLLPEIVKQVKGVL